MNNNESAFSRIFKIKELRDRILFTLGILFIYRIGIVIPVPGIDINALQSYFTSRNDANGGIENFLNFFSGGAFKNFSVFMLGMMPYISTSIIIQILMIAFPSFKKKIEEEGRTKMQSYTKIGTIFVSIVQSLTVSFYANQIDVIAVNKLQYQIISIITVTSGTMFLVWLGEQINSKGIGNGISLIIFAGIVARMPNAIASLLTKVRTSELNPVFAILSAVMFVLVVVLVIYEQKGQRRIPVHYAKRVVGRREYSSQSVYIPFRINPSGVIPVIFASTILTFPIQILSSAGAGISWVQSIANFLAPHKIPFLVLYVFFIVVFAYYYTQASMNPIEISKQIRENGGTIPGIRSEKITEYLTTVLNRILFPGSMFLAFIAITPNLIQMTFKGFPQELAYLMGGTSLLIMVGVDLDLISQIESHLEMHSQDALISKGRGRTRSF